MSGRFNYKRSDRVSELIRHEVAEIIFRETKDPRIGTVTVTRVKVSDDLRLAKVYFGVLDRTAQVEEVEKGLERASSYIHKLLVKRLRLKVVPRLTFHYDKNIDYSFHISKILKGLEGSDA